MRTLPIRHATKILHAARTHVFGSGPIIGSITQAHHKVLPNTSLLNCHHNPFHSNNFHHTKPQTTNNMPKIADLSDSTLSPVAPVKQDHKKCIEGSYPKSKIKRLTVPKDKVSWQTAWADYDPPEYESEKLAGANYADPPSKNASFKPKWNEQDGNISRKSWHGKYVVNSDSNRPQNCMGRTGLAGRGNLGRWGPNHAGDAVVTRWKANNTNDDSKNNERVVDKKSDKPIMQILLVQRADSSEWAFPGGMVDAGESHAAAIQREFMEEACSYNDMSLEEKKTAEETIEKLMGRNAANGREIYRGYVDDPRNTDNAWMETLALNFHDEQNICDSLQFKADGKESGDVKWKDVDSSLKLYASHDEIVKQLANHHGAHYYLY